MSKLYPILNQNSSPFSLLYSNVLEHIIETCPFLSLNFLKFLPVLLIAMIHKESIILTDLADVIAPTLGIDNESAERRIRRFLSNTNYDFNFFFTKFISYILSNFKIKHPDKKVFIAFDHCYIETDFTILKFTLRIGNSAIPLWFNTSYYDSNDAFQFPLFEEAINYCHNLIKSIDNDAKIIFLADRWFGSHFKILNLIDSLGDTYDIRTKGNTITLNFDKLEGHPVYKNIANLNSYAYHSAFYDDIYISRKHYSINLAISKSDKHKEPWFILTNDNPKLAIKNYGKRFSSIEFVFKAHKSGGFFLEETQIKNLFTFNSLYTCVCMAQILVTILGVDYSKNSKCYKGYKIRTTKIVNGKRQRIYSYFHIGLKLVNYVFDSCKPFNLFKRLILYDV